MPNATISVYLSDEEYAKYVERKEYLNSRAREAVKEELQKGGD